MDGEMSLAEPANQSEKMIEEVDEGSASVRWTTTRNSCNSTHRFLVFLESNEQIVKKMTQN